MAKKLSAVDWYRKFENGPAFGRVAAYIVTKTEPVVKKGASLFNRQHDLMSGEEIAADVLPNIETKTVWGKILVAYPADGAGMVHVFAWDTEGNGIQHGSASGCGYDKVSAALSGMFWDGLEFGDHCYKDGNWEQVLKDNGYTVYRAI